MHYTKSIVISLPRSRVVEVFADSDLLKHWQPTLVCHEPLSGEPGLVGTRTRLLYTMGRREVEMIETIMQRDLPNLFAATYEAKGVWNEAIHRFSDSPTGGTHWELETEFRFTGLMWLIAKLMPNMFRKETMASMQRFKAFAESAKTESR